MTCPLSQREFRQALSAYRPCRFEVFGPEDARFRQPMHHALKNRDRLFAALRAGLARGVPEGAAVVDFGPYPGTLLRLLHHMMPDQRLRLLGVGLMAGSEFIQIMKKDCGADIMAVNLDPTNPQFRDKGYPVRVPLPDHTTALAFALEIIEHLSSPWHLLQEAFRVLQPGGLLVLTTPNVTRIGNLFKVLLGRSPNDRLAPPGYFNPDDEWQPHAREYAMRELLDLCRTIGFEIVDARHFLGEDTQDCRRPVSQRIMDWVKLPFYIVPHFRGSLLLVGQKPR